MCRMELVCWMADEGARVHCLALGGMDLTSPEGKVLGRPQALTDDQQRLINEKKAQGVSLGALAKEYAVSRAAIQRV